MPNKRMKVTHVDIPGMKRKQWRVPVATSVTDATKLLRAGSRVVTAASDYGAITAWRDDEGQWRGEFHRFLLTIGRVQTKRIGELIVWLKEWWPKMYTKS